MHFLHAESARPGPAIDIPVEVGLLRMQCMALATDMDVQRR